MNVAGVWRTERSDQCSIMMLSNFFGISTILIQQYKKNFLQLLVEKAQHC